MEQNKMETNIGGETYKVRQLSGQLLTLYYISDFLEQTNNNTSFSLEQVKKYLESRGLEINKPMIRRLLRLYEHLKIITVSNNHTIGINTYYKKTNEYKEKLINELEEQTKFIHKIILETELKDKPILKNSLFNKITELNEKIRELKWEY